MPYLRSADLPPSGEGVEDPLIDGVERRYAGLNQSLRERHRAGQGMLVTGHCYLVGTQLSELSERRILGGNQHALPSASGSRNCLPVAPCACSSSTGSWINWRRSWPLLSPESRAGGPGWRSRPCSAIVRPG